MALYEEMQAAGLAQKPYGTASYLEQFSRKLQRSSVCPICVARRLSHSIASHIPYVLPGKKQYAGWSKVSSEASLGFNPVNLCRATYQQRLAASSTLL